MQINHPKLLALQDYILKMQKVAVAFSGGVDSSFLLALAVYTLGENAVGITIDSPSLAASEKKDAVYFANLIHAKHIILSFNDIDEEIRMNPVNRCYFCKKIEYKEIKKTAASLGIINVLDGSNADDLKDYRPGSQARNETSVRSPLQELGFTKDDIRSLMKEMNLPFWDKPAAACLYSRFPYGREIKYEDLRKVEAGETELKKMGFYQVRVRIHDTLARIEVAKQDIPRLIDDSVRTDINRLFKKIGFQFITFDLAGYRMGSYNPDDLEKTVTQKPL